MRRSIRRHDVFGWVDAFLHAAFARDLSAFPAPEPVQRHGDWQQLPV